MRIGGPAPATLALLFNALVWGVSWWPLRWLQQHGVHPLWATALIFVFAVAVIGLARRGAWRELRRAPALWLIALASGTTNAAFNWGVTVGDVVRVVLLFYLMPLWAVLLARVLLGERLTRLALARLALALGGAAVVLWPVGRLEFGGADLLGLVGGVSFAFNNVMLKREAARDGAARALAMFGGGALVSTALALGLALPAPPAPGTWLVGALALAALFLASNLALQYGAARLAASATAVIMVSEVLFAAVSALALGGGTLTSRLAIGGGLIVGASLLGTGLAGRRRNITGTQRTPVEPP